MEIVHLTRQYRPSVGGLEDTIQNLCTNLAKRDGIKVRIVTLNRIFTHPDKILPAHEVIDGIPVTRIDYKGSSRYPIAPHVLKEIGSADLLHVHAIDFFFDFLALTRLIHGKPMVASTHGGFFHTTYASTLKKIWFQTITRFSCANYKAICTSSENDGKTFSEIAPKKVKTIENGVNVDKWRNLGSKTPERAMIFIGRWSENKAIPYLIELTAALKKKGLPWKLIIVGVATDETSASLSANVKRWGVENEVVIRERPTEAEIGQEIGKASFLASASRYEGFGISAIEGLSAGLVTLLSPIPPYEKLRAALGLGAVIDEKNTEQTIQNLEAAYAALSADTEATRQTCMNYAQQYAWPGVTDRYIELYRRALAS